MKPVVGPFDVVPLAHREPIGAVESALRVLLALREMPQVVVRDRQLRERHREVRIEFDGPFEKRDRRLLTPTLVEVNALGVVPVRLDR